MYVLTMDDVMNVTGGSKFVNSRNNSTIIHTQDDDILFVSTDYSGNVMVSPHGLDEIFDANDYFNPTGEYSLMSYDEALEKFGKYARVIHFSVPEDKVKDFLVSFNSMTTMIPILPLMDSAIEWAEPREDSDIPVHVVVVLQEILSENPSNYLAAFNTDQNAMANFIAVSRLGNYEALPLDRWPISTED